jgi:hypothetical protein
MLPLFTIFLAAAVDPSLLMRRSAIAAEENSKKARAFAYTETIVDREFDAQGKEKERSSETWEVIGLEGSPYRKLVKRNDSPLSAKEQAKEDERLREETDKRRAESSEQRGRRLFSITYSLTVPYHRIADIYFLRLVEEKPDYWVVEGVPNPAFVPQNRDEKESMHFRIRAEIDRDDFVYRKLDMEVVSSGSRLKPGSRIEVRQEKIQDVWLIQEIRFTYVLGVVKLLKSRGERTITLRDFKKFQVESNLVGDSRK